MPGISYNNEKIEMIVIISLITVGIILGIVFYYDTKTDISAVMFSIAMAAILYKFLGGIGQQNSLAIGFLKLSGSAAVLFGFIYGLDQFIFTNEKPNSSITISPDKGWIPIDISSGQVMNVKIFEDSIIHAYPKTDDYRQKIKEHEYTIFQEENRLWIVGLGTGDTIGHTKIGKWKIKDVFRKIEFNENEDSYKFILKPNGSAATSKSVDNLDVKELPFEIQVFNNARYRIYVNDSLFANKIIKSRTGKLIPIPNSNKVYIAFIEQANSMQDTIENFSKWIIIPLEKER